MRLAVILAAAAAALFAGPATAGSFWTADCKTDPLTDQPVCQVVNNDAGILVYFGAAAQPEAVCLFMHDFPGRSAAIRIDKNPAVIIEGRACLPAGRVIAQMRKGTQVLVRSYRWPYDVARDDYGTLHGLSAALDSVAAKRAALR